MSNDPKCKLLIENLAYSKNEKLFIPLLAHAMVRVVLIHLPVFRSAHSGKLCIVLAFWPFYFLTKDYASLRRVSRVIEELRELWVTPGSWQIEWSCSPQGLSNIREHQRRALLFNNKYRGQIGKSILHRFPKTLYRQAWAKEWHLRWWGFQWGKKTTKKTFLWNQAFSTGLYSSEPKLGHHTLSFSLESSGMCQLFYKWTT